MTDVEIPQAVALAVKLSLDAPEVRQRLARSLRTRLQHGPVPGRCDRTWFECRSEIAHYGLCLSWDAAWAQQRLQQSRHSCLAGLFGTMQPSWLHSFAGNLHRIRLMAEALCRSGKYDTPRKQIHCQTTEYQCCAGLLSPTHRAHWMQCG